MKISFFLLLAVFALHAADPAEIKLWPEGPPEPMTPPSEATKEFRRTKGGKSVISDIHEPTITLFKPEKPNGTAVVVAPGGGYVFLSAVHEGSQVCEWLASIGVTGVLLKYRTPTRDDAAPHAKPVQDASRAIAWLREHAAEHRLMPDRIGLLGFSAGGNLLAHLACDRGERHERPNFGIMIYGGGFVDFKEPTKLKAGFTVPADEPPMFIACASNDGQNPLASTVLYLELKKHNIPAELHLYAQGGHGFGMRANNQPINAWPARVQEWMKSQKFGCNLEDVDSALERLNQQKFELEVRYPVPLDCGELEARREELKKQLKQATQGGDQAKEKRLRVTLAELQEEIDSRQRASDRRSVPMAPVRAEMRWFNDEKRRLSRTLGNW